MDLPESPAPGHRRRPRYRGKNPRRFEEKYKEHDPARYARDGGQGHRGRENAGRLASADHGARKSSRCSPRSRARSRLIARSATAATPRRSCRGCNRAVASSGSTSIPVELPKTEARLYSLGYGPEVFTAQRSNFAGLPQVLARSGLAGADVILADLGVSSMQLDDPARGFSVKHDGPLDHADESGARASRRPLLLQAIDSPEAR